ncbi:uncharacterized protein LOC142210521 [Leptodactylus fuscus]|uniref:uncharacterized protein LOC142210521 n=1 Tax=Leptodactylus fuscus TaxID=238119 RepID=UPI003F4F0712
MKVVLLSVALLFFTGAQGRYFWQQDEPHQEQTHDDAISSVLHDAIAILTRTYGELDFKKIAKEFHLQEKLEAAKKHKDNLEKVIETYGHEVWKKFDAQLHEKFPTFMEKVVPVLREFDDALEEQLKKMVKEVVPAGSDLIAGISSHVIQFLEKLEGFAIKSRDNLRTEVDILRGKLQPYADKVHEEYKQYRNDMEGELQKDYKEMKERAQKSYENLKKHAEPHLENLRKKFPDWKELHTKLEELMKELKEYMVAAE